MNSYIRLLNQISSVTTSMRSTISTGSPDAELECLETVLLDLVKDLPNARLPPVSKSSFTLQDALRIHFFDVDSAVRKLAPDDLRWQRAVDNGIIYNITRILDDSYEPLCESYPKAATDIFGHKLSRKWDIFTFHVIRHLKNGDLFSTGEDNEYDTFEDTAGGEDEIVWDAACAVLQRKELRV